jgi:hypothetical protein
MAASENRRLRRARQWAATLDAKKAEKKERTVPLERVHVFEGTNPNPKQVIDPNAVAEDEGAPPALPAGIDPETRQALMRAQSMKDRPPETGGPAGGGKSAATPEIRMEVLKMAASSLPTGSPPADLIRIARELLDFVAGG